MTDVVVTLNMPNIPGSQELVTQGEDVDFDSGEFGNGITQGRVLMDKVLNSLEVKDWSLFGPGE